MGPHRDNTTTAFAVSEISANDVAIFRSGRWIRRRERREQPPELRDVWL
jgi:hypothetical protein